MGIESPISVALLLEPIAGDNPAGEDLRQDPSPTSLFQSLQSAQQKARKEEKAGLMSGVANAPPVPAWDEVFDLAYQAIAEKTKDLDIAVFLLESALRRYGIAGMRDAFAVLHGLIDRYWDSLYPPADEDGGFMRRMAYLRGLDGGERTGTLIGPIQMVPLINTSGQPKITVQQYGEAPEGEVVTAALNSMNPAAATELAATAAECVEEFAGLRDSMTQNCGESAPPTRNIQEAIEQVLSAARAIEAKVAPPVEAGQMDGDKGNTGEQVGGDGGGGGGAGVGSISGPIKSRAQALAMLDAVALFFKTYDPHSFVSYGAAEIARWGRMPLHELLGDLLKDENSARETLARRLGVMIKEPIPPE